MEKRNITEILKQISLFSALTEKELSELATVTHISDYEKDSIVFTQGEISNNVMILIDGVVSVYKHDSKGNEVVIGYFNRYALLAEAATLRKTPLPSSARFQTDGSILKISLDGFERFLLSHTSLSYAIIQSLLEKIDLLQQNIHFNLAATSKEKVLNFYQKNPKLALDLKQYEIASILSMTPETLSRNISKLLKEEKLIQTSSGYKIP
ncbi:Crp/Fnr family transcriptional regulator [Sulfurovum sp. TSL1]|uniref:Crp/Fnr family transcriptional regulator n=1 Tax=Sulfurovum sp. TSL1 TaxID=2826994 RepID=UPI001CC42833|nr:Crp/Fnr family transcriptional regulator [Sulfurovum sp. TSL1]GIT98484.1 Crp/Fnr family transcriptional regulator [Sulfurovum sp. TSL1]